MTSQFDPLSEQHFDNGQQTALLDLCILATSDLHAHLFAWNYTTNTHSAGSGLGRIATLVKQTRAVRKNCLLFDNGDFLNGSSLGDFLVAKNAFDPIQITAHPMIDAMNAMRYDAVNLGNHEFSHGIAWLRSCLDQADFPAVASNIEVEGLALAKHLILERRFCDRDGVSHDLRIGLIGVLPTQTIRWEAAHLAGVATTFAIRLTTEAMVANLRARGVDLIIALCHSGIGDANQCEDTENLGHAVAQVPGIDAVILGHTHEVFPLQDAIGVLAGKPAVMPGFHGSHLGLIDLTLQASPTGWQVVGHQGQVLAVAHRDLNSGLLEASVDEDPDILGFGASDHSALVAKSSYALAKSNVALHSYFSLVTDSALGALVADAQTAYMQAALVGTPYRDLPVLSAVACFKAGGRGGPENYTDIAQGPLLLRHVDDIYGHPNSVVGLCLTGAQVSLWLERSFSLFHQILPATQDAQLINTGFPSFNFDIIWGVTFEVDLTQPARFDSKGTEVAPGSQRIKNLRSQGQPINCEQSFILVTNSYRVGTGGGFAGANTTQTIHADGTLTRDVLRDYLANEPSFVSAQRSRLWRFCPIAQASVIFDTSPKAALYLPDYPDLNVKALERQANGFQRFRLYL